MAEIEAGAVQGGHGEVPALRWGSCPMIPTLPSCRTTIFVGIAGLSPPWVFAWPDDEPETYPPPSDLVSRKHWDGIMVLPTDVALKSSDDDGSLVDRLNVLQSEWIFSWPQQGEAPLYGGGEFASR